MRVEATLPPLAEPPKTAGPQEDLTCGAGAELRRVREALRMSQAQVAAAVGLERTSITNIERGRQKLSLVTFKAIADALGMEVIVHLKPKDACGVNGPLPVECEAGHAPQGKCEFGPYGWRGVIVCKHCKQAPPDGVKASDGEGLG